MFRGKRNIVGHGADRRMDANSRVVTACAADPTGSGCYMLANTFAAAAYGVCLLPVSKAADCDSHGKRQTHRERLGDPPMGAPHFLRKAAAISTFQRTLLGCGPKGQSADR
jgi:hypothetical protein